MELKEAQKKRVCRICHLPVTKKSPYNTGGHDAFVYDCGKEHAHHDCLEEEKNSKKKIEQREMEPIKIEHLQKEIDAMKKVRASVIEASEYYGSHLILSSWDGQIKIREAFIETLKKLEETHKSQLATIVSKIDSIYKKSEGFINKQKELEEDIAKFVALLNWAKDRNKDMGSKYDESVQLIAKYRELADRILYEEKELFKVMSTFKFPNGMVATCGYDQQQILELQGEYSYELHRKITKASDEKTEWKGWEPLEEKENE